MILAAFSVNNLTLNTLRSVCVAGSFDGAQNALSRVLKVVNMPLMAVEIYFSSLVEECSKGNMPEPVRAESSHASEFGIIASGAGVREISVRNSKPSFGSSSAAAVNATSTERLMLGDGVVAGMPIAGFMLSIILLMLLNVLPRGSQIENNFKKNKTRALFTMFLREHGFFFFLNGAHGGKNE